MTRLVDALQALDLGGEIELAGHLVKVPGPRCAVYVLELAWGAGYYTWCDHPQARTIQVYQDPVAAIEAGLRRAAQVPAEGASAEG
jgi:hypothetical protein